MRTAHTVKLMCRVLKVSRSGFYEWRGRPERSIPEYQALKDGIQVHFKESRKTYGHRRVRHSMMKKGIPIGRKLTLRLMKDMALKATPWRPAPYAALKQAKESKVCKHRLRRCFQPSAPNRVWTSDITYIWTQNGWAYLAVVMDLFSRKVIGWSVSERPNTELVLSALTQALVTRSYRRWRLLFHSDQGCQYTSKELRDFLLERGILPSMSRRGNVGTMLQPRASLERLNRKRESGNFQSRE